MPDGLTAGQAALSLLIVVAVLAVGRIADLTAGSVCRRVSRLTQGPAPVTQEHLVVVPTDRRRSMLRRGGWYRAALRGPPHVVLPTS